MSSKAKMRVPDLASISCPVIPKLSEIVYILKPLEDKYHELGVQLDVGIDQLKQMEGLYQGNSRRLSETIGLWQNKSTNCSWSALADAVDRVGGYDNLVRELRAHDNCFTSDCSCNLNPSQLQCHDNTESSEDTGYLSRNGLASGDSSGSEIEHFDKIPGCGCDKPCSVYTLCVKGCPRPTNKQVGVINRQMQGQGAQGGVLPEEEVEDEDYAEKFEKGTKQMRVKFAGFVSKVCESFEKRSMTKDRVILFLKNAHPLALKPRINEMTRATNLDQVLTIVTDQACSWYDYEVIKDLVCELGDDYEKKLLGEYEVKFKQFTEQRLPKGKKHIEVGSGARVGGKQLVIKIDKEWDELTFNDLDKIRRNLASVLKVKRRDLYLADIREGCIMMTFMIPEELAERLFLKETSLASSKFLSYFFPKKSSVNSSKLLTPSQIKSLRDEGVILLTCGKLSWRSPTEQESELQYNEVSSTIL